MAPPSVDGGYYTQTPDNMPLVGPVCVGWGEGGERVQVPGAFMCGGLSGYGIMASHGVGELVAEHVVNGTKGKGPNPIPNPNPKHVVNGTKDGGTGRSPPPRNQCSEQFAATYMYTDIYNSSPS